MRYIVKNIDETTQRVQQTPGQFVLVEPGKSIITSCPPKESYSFKITEIMDEVEKMKSGTDKKLQGGKK